MESRFLINENPAIAAGFKIMTISSKVNGRLELGYGCCRSPQTLSPAFAAVAQGAGRHQNCPERAAEGDLVASLPAFAAVAQGAGRPKAIL